MHLQDALLSASVGGTFWAVSSAAVGYSAYRLSKKVVSPALMGVMGGFVFAGQMINFAIPGTGASGHIGGGLLLAAVLGPHAAMITITTVLLVQALCFADGGLLALGCNIFNMGVIPILFIYPLLERLFKSNRSKLVMVPAVAIALEIGALMVSMQILVSARASLPAATLIALMLGIHLPIGIVEGLVTAGVLTLLVREMKNKLHDVGSTKRIVAAVAVATIIVGTVVAWHASSKPDGLEWALEETKFKETASTYLQTKLGKLQNKISFLPDYGFKNAKESEADRGTSVSGLVGFILSFTVIGTAAFFLGRRQRAKQ